MVPARGRRLPRTGCWLDCHEGFRRHRYTAVEPSSPHPRCLRAGKFAAVMISSVVVVVGLMFFTAGTRSQPQQQQQQQQLHTTAVPETILVNSAPTQANTAAAAEANISLWTSYSDDGDMFSLDQLYPWRYLAEPHRRSVLMIDAQQQDGLEASVRWAVDGIELGTGTSVETTFKAPGVYPCTVTVSFAQPSASRSRRDKEEEAEESQRQRQPSSSFLLSPPETTAAAAAAAQEVTHSFDVAVKYVRREIRDLADRDREAFFNAVAVLQRVPSAVGREIYGSKYYSKDYFNRLHLHYGAQKDCDHWHDGAGFVTSHVAISLMYEQALQSIDPSIALPYWDFTVEGSMYDWTDFRTSSGVFSDDWFGSATSDNSLMTPGRGRFGFVPVMTNATEYSELHNPYGLLRSPWNSNPDPFLTRHDRLFGYSNNRKPAGCKQYRDAARQNTWMLLTEAMNAGAHGHIHELLGGAWSMEWSGFYNRTDEIVLPFTHVIVPLMKYLWRADYLKCPAACDFSVKWADCQCALDMEMVAGQTPAEVLKSSGVLSEGAGAFFYDQDLKLIDSLTDEQGRPYSRIPGYTTEETEDIFAEMLRLLSTPMRIGSHYEGTSTNDATFWVIHPTFDRLWHLSRLENVADEESFDETWLDDHSCYGHNPADIQPFHDLFPGAAAGDTQGGGEEEEQDDDDDDDVVATRGEIAPPKAYYTNQKLYELLKPNGRESPYVYDHFEWPHCDALGVHLRAHASRG